MTTITEFLLARIAEDEAAARQEDPSDRWDIPTWMEEKQWESQPHSRKCGARLGSGVTHNCECEYPARVLRECEAKRRIVNMHGPSTDCDGNLECDQCSFHELYEGFNDVSEPFPCVTLRLLALVYADHLNYDEAWRP